MGDSWWNHQDGTRETHYSGGPPDPTDGGDVLEPLVGDVPHLIPYPRRELGTTAGNNVLREGQSAGRPPVLVGEGLDGAGDTWVSSDEGCVCTGQQPISYPCGDRCVLEGR